jgi:hypothetical protein
MAVKGLAELLNTARVAISVRLPRSVHAALLVTITAYSVVDKLGVGLVSPVVYLAGLAAVTGVVLAPFSPPPLPAGMQGGVADQPGGGLGTYLLILTAFRQVQAGYVVAARELSIAVAVALGLMVLREPLTVPKALSTAAILVEVVLVKVA